MKTASVVERSTTTTTAIATSPATIHRHACEAARRGSGSIAAQYSLVSVSMCRSHLGIVGTIPPVASIELPPERSAAASARRFTREVAAGWDLDSDVQADVELLVSELVTNAVLHARSPARLSIERQGDHVRVTVGDDSTAQPKLRDYGAEAVTGRGIFLVDQISERWGVEVESNGRQGKRVWFEIATNASTPTEEVRS
jgi:anti-sigma regulatory factor (Ser/Thr protein kinase)